MIQILKEEIKLFTDDMTLYMEGKKKNSAKKILQITSEFDKVAECKMEKCTILYKKNLQWQRKNC